MAGSIEKRGKNSYRLVCLAGYYLQGKPIKKTKTIHGTKKEAEIELAKFIADVQNGMFVEGKSLQVIAKEENCTKQSVFKSISKALDKLRIILEKNGYDVTD